MRVRAPASIRQYVLSAPILTIKPLPSPAGRQDLDRGGQIPEVTFIMA
jgi:hypothetical protein